MKRMRALLMLPLTFFLLGSFSIRGLENAIAITAGATESREAPTRGGDGMSEDAAARLPRIARVPRVAPPKPAVPPLDVAFASLSVSEALRPRRDRSGAHDAPAPRAPQDDSPPSAPDRAPPAVLS